MNAADQDIKGSCHCGLVTFSLPEPPDSITECNCSICSRYAALWAYYRRDQVRLEVRDNTAVAYRWGDRMIDFIHCRQCGCLTHYEDVEKTPGSRLAVNYRMCGTAAREGIRIRHFDGADTFREIPDV